ncbi:MAG: SDR family oxidoreductase [Balneolaceae bacterium]|nr:SDR family oxidoreductase [Balneolaceae bacterium]
MEQAKVILVTGANRGIGYEICRQLSNRDHTVLLTARNREQGRKAAEELEAVFCRLDVTDQDSIDQAVEFVAQKHGRLDVLINNAGIMIDDSNTAKNADMDTIKKTLDVNLYGPLRLSQRFLPLLRESDDPRIINISSGMGAICHGYGADHPSYRISKSALNALTRALAEDLKDEGFRINAVSPGWVHTDMGGKAAPRDPEQGADTPVWLATADEIPTGTFVRDREPRSW